MLYCFLSACVHVLQCTTLVYVLMCARSLIRSRDLLVAPFRFWSLRGGAMRCNAKECKINVFPLYKLEMYAIDYTAQAESLQCESKYEEALPFMIRSMMIREESLFICLTSSDLVWFIWTGSSSTKLIWCARECSAHLIAMVQNARHRLH